MPLRHLVAAVGAATAWPAWSAVPCGSIGGAEQVLERTDARYVIVGERHGTEEIPAFFADLVCQASERAPVIVGLEIEAPQQASIEAYLQSDGSPAARAALLREDHWRYGDGRASAAMFALLERLRQLRGSGRQITFLAFMVPAPDAAARERGMAEAWMAALRAQPRARLLALIGRVHAETQPIGFAAAAASYVPAAQRLTLSYVPFEAARGPRRIMTSAPAEHSWPRYDLFYSVGSAFTSSPPARGQGR
jgi:hypothetical protein